MKVTLKAAAAPSLAPRASTAKPAVPGVMKAAAMQQIPGINFKTQVSVFIQAVSDVHLSEDKERFAAHDVNDERESNVGGDLDQADKNKTEVEIVYYFSMKTCKTAQAQRIVCRLIIV